MATRWVKRRKRNCGEWNKSQLAFKNQNQIPLVIFELDKSEPQEETQAIEVECEELLENQIDKLLQEIYETKKCAII